MISLSRSPCLLITTDHARLTQGHADVCQIPRDILPKLVNLVSIDKDTKRRPTRARILFTAERRIPELEKVVDIIKVPPLRVRPEDISDIINHMLKRMGKGCSPVGITPEAQRKLQAYNFPDNLNELEVKASITLKVENPSRSSSSCIHSSQLKERCVFALSSSAALPGTTLTRGRSLQMLLVVIFGLLRQLCLTFFFGSECSCSGPSPDQTLLDFWTGSGDEGGDSAAKHTRPGARRHWRDTDHRGVLVCI